MAGRGAPPGPYSNVIAFHGGEHEQEDPEAKAALAAQEGQSRQTAQLRPPLSRPGALTPPRGVPPWGTSPRDPRPAIARGPGHGNQTRATAVEPFRTDREGTTMPTPSR